eukprot:4057066-Prymnesium_polylepis.3
MVRAILIRALTPLVLLAALPLLWSAAAVAWRAGFLRKMGFSTQQPAVGSQPLRSALSDGFLSGLALSFVVSFCFTSSVHLFQPGRSLPEAHSLARQLCRAALWSLSWQVSAFVFQAWQCEKFVYDSTEEHSFLGKDLSVRCDSDEYSQIVAVAWSFVALWPIGMVALFAVALFPVRNQLLEDRPTPLVKATTFLTRDYKVSRDIPLDAPCIGSYSRVTVFQHATHPQIGVR